MSSEPIDRLAEATGGKLHWDDPGMDDFEKGDEPFTLGKRVEIRAPGNRWVKGTVVETTKTNDRAIVVKTDDKVHDKMDFYDGRGLTIMVYNNTRRGILSNIRELKEKEKPKELKGNAAELLEIMESAAKESNGRLRIVYKKSDQKTDAGRVLQFDGKPLGQQLEAYERIAETDELFGWGKALAKFLDETLYPIRLELPRSYEVASIKLKELGEKVYKGDVLEEWKNLFETTHKPIHT